MKTFSGMQKLKKITIIRNIDGTFMQKNTDIRKIYDYKQGNK